VRTLGYWFVRAALFFSVVLALWALGLRSWSAAIVAVPLSWLIAFAVFGTEHDPLAQLVERHLSKRSDRGNEGKEG
jgi:Cu/Ag efflux pump CusA